MNNKHKIAFVKGTFFIISLGLLFTSKSSLAAFECEAGLDNSSNDLKCSGLTDVSRGNPPELALSFKVSNPNSEEFYSLEENTFSEGQQIELTNGSAIMLEYELKNSLTEILIGDVSDDGRVINSHLKQLPEGKFDIDGDPIDTTAVYQSIEWTILPENSDPIVINKSIDKDILTLDTLSCINGSKIQARATPYTVTGKPEEGEATTLTLKNSLGEDYILSQCAPPISDDELKVVIFNHSTKGFLVDETEQNEVDPNNINLGDEIEAKIYAKSGSDEDGNITYTDVTSRYQQTFVWGYKFKKGDPVHFSGSQFTGEDEIIWMDGDQEVGTEVSKKEAKTTGENMFQVQVTNANARAKHSINKSEQSMRIQFKFGGDNK